MGINVTCDYCGRTINYYSTTGKLDSEGTVDIVQKTCSNCTKDTVKTRWPSELITIKSDWETEANERKNFFKQQLRKEKELFYINKAKAFFGSFYTAEIEQEIKDMLK